MIPMSFKVSCPAVPVLSHVFPDLSVSSCFFTMMSRSSKSRGMLITRPENAGKGGKTRRMLRQETYDKIRDSCGVHNWPRRVTSSTTSLQLTATSSVHAGGNRVTNNWSSSRPATEIICAGSSKPTWQCCLVEPVQQHGSEGSTLPLQWAFGRMH